jgi:hypothetical protein
MERLLRFTALFLLVSVSVAGGTALLYAITRSFQPLRFLVWVAYAVVFLLFGYWLVVAQAATDNIVILLRGDANLLSWLALSLWMFLLAFGASLLAERMSGVFTGTLAALFGLVLLAPLSYGALWLAAEPRVLGPESGLSALEFLLAGNRSEYVLPGAELFGRYLLTYLAMTLLLTFAQYPVWVAYSTRRFAHNPLMRPEQADSDAVASAAEASPGRRGAG